MVHQTIFIPTISLQNIQYFILMIILKKEISLFTLFPNFKLEWKSIHIWNKNVFFVNCFAFGKPVNQSVLEIAPLERRKVIAIKRIKTASRPFPFFVLCIAETAVCILGGVNYTV